MKGIIYFVLEIMFLTNAFVSMIVCLIPYIIAKIIMSVFKVDEFDTLNACIIFLFSVLCAPSFIVTIIVIYLID